MSVEYYEQQECQDRILPSVEIGENYTLPPLTFFVEVKIFVAFSAIFLSSCFSECVTA